MVYAQSLPACIALWNHLEDWELYKNSLQRPELMKLDRLSGSGSWPCLGSTPLYQNTHLFSVKHALQDWTDGPGRGSFILSHLFTCPLPPKVRLKWERGIFNSREVILTLIIHRLVPPLFLPCVTLTVIKPLFSISMQSDWSVSNPHAVGQSGQFKTGVYDLGCLKVFRGVYLTRWYKTGVSSNQKHKINFRVQSSKRLMILNKIKLDAH